MTYTITEADRKRLAKLCDKKYFPESIRKWNTSYERQILCEALMREGKWEDFLQDHIDRLYDEEEAWSISQLFYYLLIEQPERCNYLISKFLEEE
jgi:hypothetical protein